MNTPSTINTPEAWFVALLQNLIWLPSTTLPPGRFFRYPRSKPQHDPDWVPASLATTLSRINTKSCPLFSTMTSRNKLIMFSHWDVSNLGGKSKALMKIPFQTTTVYASTGLYTTAHTERVVRLCCWVSTLGPKDLIASWFQKHCQKQCWLFLIINVW